MKHTHPPALLTLVARSLRGECTALRGRRALVAMSGGVDSQVLLHALAWHRKAFALDLVAHGVDHGLRADAAAELDLAAGLAESLAVPFARTRVAVAPGSNLQARARDARLAALRSAAVAAGATFIVTAHHADDRAETLLIRLLRGAGPRGLAVLPPVADDLARPLLRASRADIAAHAARHGLAYAQDPSNEDPRFVRVRVRRELMPLLRALDPRVVDHVNRLADSLASTRTGDDGGHDADDDEAAHEDDDREFVTNDE
jgi:tRNA(Ile)-lysidine synthase